MKKRVFSLEVIVFLILGAITFLVSYLVDFASQPGSDTNPFEPYRHGYLGASNFLAIERVSFSAQSRFLFFAVVSWMLFGSMYFLISLFKRPSRVLSLLFLFSFLASLVLSATTSLFSPRRKTVFDFAEQKVRLIYSRYLFFPIVSSFEFSQISSLESKKSRKGQIWVSEITLRTRKGETILLGYCPLSDSTQNPGIKLTTYIHDKMGLRP